MGERNTPRPIGAAGSIQRKARTGIAGKGAVLKNNNDIWEYLIYEMIGGWAERERDDRQRGANSDTKNNIPKNK